MLSPRLLALLGPVAAFGCASPKPPTRYEILVEVTSDPEKAVAGAPIVIGERVVAETNAEGRATVSVFGAEGEMVDVGVRCPARHTTPPPTRVSLHRIAETTDPPRHALRCEPLVRSVIVAIRAPGGASLPVLHMSSVVATTNPEGAATAHLELSPGQPFELSFDTKHAPDLRPANPTIRLVAPDRDGVVMLAQDFTRVKKKALRIVGKPGPRILTVK